VGQNSPENFKHKWLLVSAEIARIEGRGEAAAALYDAAITSAQANGITQDEALANESAARFYATGQRDKLTRSYAEEARYLYAKWGANAKAEAMVAEFPFLAILPEPSRVVPIDNARTTDSLAIEKSSTLDLATVVKAAQALSGEIDLRRLLQKLLRFALENAGATRGALVLQQDGQLLIEAIGSVEDEQIALPSQLLESGDQLPLSVVQYVARTRESVVLSDASNAGLFTSDSYIMAHNSKSVLCAPIVYQAKLNGLIYLENHLATGAFTPGRLEVLGVLSAQAAISLQNARLYGQLEEYSRTLEQRVADRTEELRGKNEQLRQTLRDLQEMQNRVIVQEKMASLGALTAGIAHEIKNPLNFVNNFAELSVELAQELDEELEKLQTAPDEATRELVVEILGDLKSNAQKINEHGKRADSIVRNMLLHSRGQGGEPEATDIMRWFARLRNWPIMASALRIRVSM
jgi:GAF domain-containing protein